MTTTADADSQAFGSIDTVNKSLEGGSLFCKDLVRFFKKRAKIEDEYNKSLQKMSMKMEATVPNRYLLSVCYIIEMLMLHQIYQPKIF